MKEKKMGKLAQSVVESVSNKISTSVLTQTLMDWQKEFPDLKRFKSTQKLLKRIGPAIIGIELEKYMSDKYRPRLVLINLLDTSYNKISPCVYQSFKNKKGNELFVAYKDHSHLYLDACKIVENEARISLRNKPTLNEIIEGIFIYIEEDLYSANPFDECKSILLFSRLLHDEKMKEFYFDKAVKLMEKKIPHSILEDFTGGFKSWIEIIKNLDSEKLNKLQEESINKYKLIEI
ncbi:MAG: hypothetical protein NVV82_19355 [Sporocytophaga sp.]|nr:hypothetical protein [Sporocytophaga sp.]